MSGALIIGCGNVLRGDDAVGLHVARILGRRGFDAVAIPQLAPELAERIAQSPSVVFVDADMRVAPGHLSITELRPGSARAGAFEHFAAPQGLLDLTFRLYGAAPEAWLVSIGAEDLAIGRRLTRAARRGVRRAVSEIADLFREEILYVPCDPGRSPEHSAE